jgi:hypothetical protein
MAIDLADYTPSIKAALKKGGFACVYVAATPGGRPCRVGYALDLVDAFKRLARASPLPIVVDEAIWVPDRSIATTIAQSVLASIAQHRQEGGWHDLSAGSAAIAVQLETCRLYPSATTVPHSHLIAQWASRRRA